MNWVAAVWGFFVTSCAGVGQDVENNYLNQPDACCSFAAFSALIRPHGSFMKSNQIDPRPPLLRLICRGAAITQGIRLCQPDSPAKIAFKF